MEKIYMKFTGIFFLFFSFSCGAKKDKKIEIGPVAVNNISKVDVQVQDTFKKGELIPTVICKTDPAQSYALYIPLKVSKDVLPIIYFFDPHGNGALPLAKYKSLADQYGFILAGSNNSKNGNDFSVAEDIWTNLLYDTKSRLKIDASRIYTCGFSGGAKVAGFIALKHPEVKSVIACGAGLPDGTLPADFRFTYTGIAGEGDMNMTDLVAFDTALDATKTSHRLILFDGKHEWAPDQIMNIAFAGLQLDAMREKLIPLDDKFLTAYISNSKNTVSDYIQKGQFTKAESECLLSLRLLEGVTKDAEWFHKKNLAIKNSAEYQKQYAAKQALLLTEQNIKAEYRKQFQQGDMNYWLGTIKDLQVKSNQVTGEGAMYQRLMAYLSLAFYSISNQMINSHQDREAQYFVELYKLDDPSNNEAWYLSAIVNARSGNPEAVKSDLNRAIETGFTDKTRLEKQVEFQALSINYAELEAKMKK
ncbi:MAG: hypothetical protein JSS70_01975 [Bacteroidetes bacterium]|nr:hypothetical protein [Bacteroidota bacterium]